MPIGVERHRRIDFCPSEIVFKCPTVPPILAKLTNSHESAPRFELNPNDRLHDRVGISCQDGNDLKLLVIRSVERASVKSCLAYMFAVDEKRVPAN